MGLGIWLITSSFAVLSLIVLLAGIMPITTLSAEALTQNDIDDTNNSIISLQEKLDNVEKSIITKNETIQSLHQERDQLYKTWQQLEYQKMQSWDALEQVGPIKTQLDSIESTITSEQRQLGTLYATKSDYTIQISQLQEKLSEQKHLLSLMRDRTPFDISTIPKHIGIELSQNCINMIINDIPNNCPDPHDLIDIDTSIQSFSGTFDDMGFREKSPYKNSCRLYDFDDTPRIFWDPPDCARGNIKMITIESRLEEYFTVQDMQLDNGIRTWYESRYVDNCKDAVISAVEWKTLLPDTIYLFNNGCTDSKFNEFNFEKMSFTILPLDQTQYWKDKVWLEETKERCKGLCFDY